MKIHLIDGTYELFRSYYAVPRTLSPDGHPSGAVKGLIRSILYLLRQENVTHVGCAFDHVIESFRNKLFTGYKTGAHVPDDLLLQFDLAERAMTSLGIVVWPMVEHEADDAIASAAVKWQYGEAVNQIVICSPDKDLAQVVDGTDIVCWDRRREITYDETAVRKKFGVSPKSIPDYLALVGDKSDGIPGVPMWGVHSTARVLRHYTHIENIPQDASDWAFQIRGSSTLACNLHLYLNQALLYRKLATLKTDVPLPQTLSDLKWHGVRKKDFQALCDELGVSRLRIQPHEWNEAD